MTEKIINNHAPQRPAADDLDETVIVELRLPKWMRLKLNIRALEAGFDIGQRNHYVRRVLLAAWEAEDK
jgi:hypothetical protein